MHPEPSPPKIN